MLLHCSHFSLVTRVDQMVIVLDLVVVLSLKMVWWQSMYLYHLQMMNSLAGPNFFASLSYWYLVALDYVRGGYFLGMAWGKCVVVLAVVRYRAGAVQVHQALVEIEQLNVGHDHLHVVHVVAVAMAVAHGNYCLDAVRLHVAILAMDRNPALQLHSKALDWLDKFPLNSREYHQIPNCFADMVGFCDLMCFGW